MSTPLPFELTGLTLIPGRKLSAQLYDALRELIIGNPLSSGMKLPASRELAEMLDISRNTVMNVYERLFAEGFIETRVGDGTYVARLHSPSNMTPLPGLLNIEPQMHTGYRLPAASLFNQHRIHEGAPKAFRIGMPAIDLFPFETWSRLQTRFWRREPVEHMGYGHPAGEPQLRELIAHYLRHARGLKCEPSQIVITLGAQQAIMICSALLLRAEDEVILENPCYWAAAGAFSCLGAKVNGIDVDEEGLQTSQLRHFPHARLAYVSPSCQYPTGVTLSMARRLELLQWAQERKSWIIEDDYDGEYRYSGTPLTPLAAIDQSNRVLYIGSFSKVMYPGLRLGYLVAPKQLVEQFLLVRTMASRQPPMNDQMAMTLFLSEGHFQQHSRRMRRAALARRDALLEAWGQHLQHIGHMTRVSSGLHVTIRLGSYEKEQRLIALASMAGIEITPLSASWLPGSSDANSGRYGLVLGFASVKVPDILLAVESLKRVWANE
ncbi:PLP-dependent aminotransferase family protein [Rahnella woolbedingensis]|uniref:PLP-dependent aminotransferase family protein n=1 Tax=Rahnella woolbedingensis TaxID=1510574 RepID=A0A419N6H0_9GAMM|nr:PLP-dependent aminotransferase family protein [Rahnella woolbedingensis]RJT42882.1 PLP-dependent aminotransferase family protein [Rahnella woolbedingensis]